MPESIIDIKSSFTIYQGKYKDSSIIVKEIFEKYTSIRQWVSYISEIKAYDQNFSREHDSFMDLLAVSLSENRLFMLFHNCSQLSLHKYITTRK